jgi:CBS domain-containing protein
VKISDILRHKISQHPDGDHDDAPAVVTMARDDRVEQLVASLAGHGIGAVVVSDGAQVVGIASERDVVRALAASGADALTLTLADIMTSPVVTCSPGDSVDSVAAMMTERRVRHLPVLDDGRLIGIVSIGDVVLSRINQLEQDRGQLEQYITG